MTAKEDGSGNAGHLRVTKYDDAMAFHRDVEAFLVRDEARNNLMLGLLGTLVEQPHIYPRFELWRVAVGTETAAAALRTPPHLLVVSSTRDGGALDRLARAIAAEPGRLPGVVAGDHEARVFSDSYCRETGLSCRTTMEQWIYRLGRVLDVPRPAGGPRSAELADLPWILNWLRAFHEESGSGSWDGEVARRRLASRLRGERGEGLWCWDDPEPVCLAGFVAATPNGVRIGPVYTPPSCRRRGYATALVAEVSRAMLGRGNRFCFLYADAANPTSNAIYQRVGFRQVARSRMVRFGSP